ncbi:subtilisin-like protein [Myriangium duriaei CBS 260.36]|uniref:Subtilisin-like protein n=1 Tax=Myriangium duriaei CBS 260.36 TaxID=1168546 RepID=A0A9P4MKQ4_9PEZI|nr:subtilisin-like protein [Myriangium duriaei CBS 260.36]
MNASPISPAGQASSDSVNTEDVSALDVSDRYIITLKSGVDVPQHMSLIKNLHTRRSDRGIFSGIMHEYNISDFRGYAGHFDKSVVEQLKVHEDVETIEEDKIWTASGWSTAGLVEQKHALGGLALISHKKIVEGTYSYDSSAGAGTYAYVVDSGINIKHEELENRASLGYNSLNKMTTGFDDKYGHGSNIAGIIGGKTFGVAKKCNLVAVKVLEADKGKLADILAGYNWAINDITSKRRTAKAVINVSVYGTASPAWTKAVDTASGKGISTVLSAGNDGKDLGRGTFVLPKTAITVSATDKNRKKADFANYGSTVDLYAPGVQIMSISKGDKRQTAFGSGTSQASAFVAGVVVYFKGMQTLGNAQATKNFVMKSALRNVVKTPLGGSEPFLYNNSGK